MASRHPTYLGDAQSANMQHSDDDDDQVNLQEAIEESLRQDRYRFIEPTDKKVDEVNPPVHTCQNRVSIDDRINDMTMQAAIELPSVHDPQGDTWIYIDAPQRQPEQDEHDYEHYIKRYAAPMLMKKDTLTKYSPGLANLFGPTEQFRFLRRHKLVNKLPGNVKYVIDLTPPSEGEDAVFLTTELCCSEGVRLWYQSNQIWSVSKTLVKGAEEYSSVSAKPELGPPRAPGGSGVEATSSTIIPLEYSPIRHRSAIERVLSALQGEDPILNSAIKVWTTFAVAKNFEITHSPLEDYIIRWLRAYPNSYFLEVLPEVSHQIADGLQNYDLARDSFAILVGEEALDSLRRAREPRLYTRFGRKKEELPEHIHTRIEYASKSFLERLNNDFTNFVVNGMRWVEELPEVRRLSAYTQPKLQTSIQKLKDLLKDYVRGTIYRLLCIDYCSMPGPDLHHRGGHDLLPRVNRTTVWASMPPRERILSRTYWEALRSFDLFRGVTNFDIENSWGLTNEPDPYNPIEYSRFCQGTYRTVMNWEIGALIQDGQTHLDQMSIPSPNVRKAQQWLNSFTTTDWSETLPDRTLTRTRDLVMNNGGPLSTPAEPVGVPNPLKRSQHSSDAFSTPDQQSQFESRRKWPFGAARDDLLAQVQKRVDGLHFSPVAPDRGSLTGPALQQSLGQRPRNEGSTRPDPWHGYSDQLSQANDALKPFSPKAIGDWDEDQQNSAPKTSSKITKLATKETAVLVGPDFWAGIDAADGDGQDQKQLEVSTPKKTNLAAKFFDLEEFFVQARFYITTFAMNKLRSSDQLELGIVNTLVCLEDSEWKYLPLWAGGNDDGSMGVYNDDLPTAEQGFTTAGPDVHDGSTPASSSKAPSEFDFVSAGDSASTFNTSTATNRGFSDTIRRGRVHAVDSADDSMSDSFTMVTPSVDSDDEETFARKQIEDQERIEEAEEAAANEARRIVKGKGKVVEEDESYADLFQGEEEDDDGTDTDRAEGISEDEDEDEEDMVLV